MNRKDLRHFIETNHKNGKKVAVHFCSYVPEEILEAAGFASIRISHVDGVEAEGQKHLPNNVCSIVKEVCNICESDLLDDVDLIIAETSCDGKKKMFELLEKQGKMYYYQIPQGSDREYVIPLILSELKHLIKMLKDRFNIEVSEEEIRKASLLLNSERQAVMDLMELQKTDPPKAYGSEIYAALQDSSHQATREERIAVLTEKKDAILEQCKNRTIPSSDRRILVTGCPMGGVYEKVLSSIEENGGVVVCFENCEAVKSNIRTVNLDDPDIYHAIAECYRNTACANMAPNPLRFELLKRLTDEYLVDGIIDVTLQTCHPYSVERFKLQRFCRDDLDLPYGTIETEPSPSDAAQLRTRLTAFLEMC